MVLSKKNGQVFLAALLIWLYLQPLLPPPPPVTFLPVSWSATGTYISDPRCTFIIDSPCLLLHNKKQNTAPAMSGVKWTGFKNQNKKPKLLRLWKKPPPLRSGRTKRAEYDKNVSIHSLWPRFYSPLCRLRAKQFRADALLERLSFICQYMDLK